MKILLANNILGGLTGSETWIYAMKEELESLNHEVITYTPNQNINNKEKIDLAIINHNTCLNKLKELDCIKIFTSHGILPELEQPIGGADIYVSVSEEVQFNLSKKGFKSVIIRNGINCDYFKKTRETNSAVKNILFSSNYKDKYSLRLEKILNLIGINITINGKIRAKILKAGKQLGIKIEIIGINNKISNVMEAINRADLVIGLGRTAYEAMACERNVIIYDYNGGDGFCTPEKMLEFRKNNCSGRRYKINFSVNQLKNEILKYNQENGKQLREYILNNNNIKKTTQEYLKIYYELTPKY